jgi:hypothetical protein
VFSVTDKGLLQAVLPIIMLVVVVGLRLRSMARPQPLRSTRMWIVPGVLVLLGIAALVANPLTAEGWAISAAALALGAALGWRRGKMIRIWRDGSSGEPMQQASPAAMAFLLGVIAVRYLVRVYFGVAPGNGGALDPRALIATDALLTFAIGLVIATRAELFLRARRLLEAG